MFRFSGRILNASVHSDGFISRISELSQSEKLLGCKEYKFLRNHLTEYKRLQTCYAVKQSDVERARRAANQCGLEFTGKKGRIQK